MSTHKAFQMNSLSEGRRALESNGSLADLLGQGVDYVVPGPHQARNSYSFTCA